MELKQAYQRALEVAKGIAKGEIDPYEGSMRVWRETLDPLEVGIPDDLWAFKSNASAIEDAVWNAENGGEKNEKLIESCKAEIWEASKNLVDKYNRSPA